MISKTRIMLYVEDVAIISNFFINNLEAKISEENELPEGFKNIVLSISNDLELALFPSEFIKKYSPEVYGNVPSIMFFTNHFDELYEKLGNNGEIFNNTFNFSDPEGNFYVMTKK